ncbi:hypothetical protein ES703_85562 [subsurface metagenome]
MVWAVAKVGLSFTAVYGPPQTWPHLTRPMVGSLVSNVILAAMPRVSTWTLKIVGASQSTSAVSNALAGLPVPS